MNGFDAQLLRGSVEIGLVVLIIAGLTRLVGERRSRLCALLWLLVFVRALTVFLPLGGWQIGLALPGTGILGEKRLLQLDGPTVASDQPISGRLDGTPADKASAMESFPRLPRWLPDMSLWSSFWVLGVAGMLLRFARDTLGFHRIRRAAGRPPEALVRIYRAEASRCGVRSPPGLLIHSGPAGPMVAGGWRPIIIVPHWLVGETNPSQLRWVLRHELIHVRHRDHLALLVKAAAEILFWFHPLIWWSAREWRRTSERACDDAAVGNDPREAREYAETLYAVLRRLVGTPGPSGSSLGLPVARTDIGRRIERLLERKGTGAGRISLSGRFAFLILAGASLLLGFGPADTDPPVGRSTRSALRIDFGPNDQRVEPGWERWSGDRDRDFVTPFDLDFEIEIDRGPAWRDGDGEANRDRLAAVLEDGLRERDDEAIGISLKRLDPGDYVLELFSVDPGGDAGAEVGRFDLQVDGKSVLRDQVTRGGVSPTGSLLPPVPLVSQGETVRIELQRLRGEIWLNGLILTGPTRWIGEVRPGRVEWNEVPLLVQAVIERETKGAEIDRIRRKVVDDARVYSVDATTPEGELELLVGDEGSLLERNEAIAAGALPAAVRQVLPTLGEDLKIREVRRVSRIDGVTFVIDLKRDGDRLTLAFAPDGTLLSRRDRD